MATLPHNKLIAVPTGAGPQALEGPEHDEHRNPGMELDLDWVEAVRVNRSAVERRAATIPISGRFVRSRSPPAPNTTISRPGVNGRTASSERLRRAPSLCCRRQSRARWCSSVSGR